MQGGILTAATLARMQQSCICIAAYMHGFVLMAAEQLGRHSYSVRGGCGLFASTAVRSCWKLCT